MRIFSAKFFVAALFVILAALSMAGTKVAMLGDSPEADAVADAALAILSSSRDVSFLERKEAGRILQEQGLARSDAVSAVALGKIEHVDALVLISSCEEPAAPPQKPKTVPSGILIFDAKSGARLLDAPLRGDTAKAASETASMILRAAEERRAGRERRLVSTLAVRNAGGAKKFEPSLALVAASVERRLSASPDAAVLERASLGLVNEERKISEETHRLAPSAFLLDYEMTPGPAPDKPGLVVRVFNTSGAELKKFPFENCMSDPKGTSDKVFGQLAEFLSIAPPEKAASPEEEAARFYREFKFHEKTEDFAVAEKKIEACAALDPAAQEYLVGKAGLVLRKGEAEARRLEMPGRFDALVASSSEAGRILNDAMDRFPDSDKPFYSKVWQTSPLENIINNHTLSQKQKAAAEKMADLTRPYILRETARSFKFDLSAGIKSMREMENYRAYCRVEEGQTLHFDERKRVDVILRNTREILQHGGAFLRKNPDLAASLPLSGQTLFVPSPSPPLKSLEKELAKYLSEAGDVEKLALEHPAALAKTFGLAMELARKTIRNGHKLEKFEADMDETLQKSEKANVPTSACFDECAMDQFFVVRILDEKQAIREAYYRKLIEWNRKKGVTSSWFLARAYLETFPKEEPGKTAAAVEWLAPEMEHHKSDKSKSRGQCEISRANIAALLREAGKQTGLSFEKALEILEEKRKIKPLRLATAAEIAGVGHGGAAFCGAGEDDGGGVFALLLKPGACVVVSCGVKKQVAAPVAEAPTKDLEFADPRPACMTAGFSVGETFFILGGKNKILLMPRDGSAHRLIGGLPAENVQATAELEGRIYAFAGRQMETGAMETVMCSSLPDGTDRRIHMSTLSKDAAGTGGSPEPFVVSRLVADGKNRRLLFLKVNPRVELCEFQPESGRFKKLLAFPRAASGWCAKTGRSLHLSDRHEFHRLDLDSGADTLLANNDTTRRDHMRPPFLPHGGRMWFGGWKPAVADGRDFDKHEVINLDSASVMEFFPHPDGRSVVAVTEWSIWLLTPPE